MPSIFGKSIKPKITLPTGYEAEQRKAETKRKIAEAMIAKGLSPQGDMRSWTQALASVANAGVGKWQSNKADKLEDSSRSRMMSDYVTARGELNADVAAGLPSAEIVAKHGGNALLQEDLKPHIAAQTAAMTNRESLVNLPQGFGRKGDYMGPGAPKLPNDMNKPIIYGPQGEAMINELRTRAALGAQGYRDPQGNMPTGQMFDPSQAPPVPPGGQPSPMGMPQEALMPPANIPTGSPLDPDNGGIPPADGTTEDGQPAWLINGQWYDNPEGR